MEDHTKTRIEANEQVGLLLHDVSIIEKSIEREKQDALNFKSKGLPELERQCYFRMNKKSREIIEINLKIENLKKDL